MNRYVQAGLSVALCFALSSVSHATNLDNQVQQLLKLQAQENQQKKSQSKDSLKIGDAALRALLKQSTPTKKTSKRSTKRPVNQDWSRLARQLLKQEQAKKNKQRKQVSRVERDVAMDRLVAQYLKQKKRAKPQKSAYRNNKYSYHQFKRAISKARKMLNVPYVWGGTTPRGFDCSGLVQYTYRYAGIKLPRTAATQYRATKRVSLAQARPGDLIFFHIPQPRKVYVNHVSIYLGHGRMLHAPGFGTRVSIEPLDDLWKQHVVGVGRPV